MKKDKIKKKSWIIVLSHVAKLFKIKRRIYCYFRDN